MIYFYLISTFLFGLAIGSFLSAYTFRLGVGKSVKDGRSFCDKCKKRLSWHDNLPLLSFLLLQGKCRQCGKSISPRYPLIEFSTATLFAAIYYFTSNCATSIQGPTLQGSAICFWSDNLGIMALPYLLLVTAIFIAIFVIDFEQMIIPDELVWALALVTLFALLFTSSESLYLKLFAAFAISTFLLTLNLMTRGKGMGLGDVKLAIAGGLILGSQGSMLWIVASFVIGALVGVFLLYKGKAKLGKQIPFGPFMVIAFFLSLFVGNRLFDYFFPYL